jgi:hypothetical protein
MHICTRVHTQDELRYITYVLDSTKNVHGTGDVLFLLQRTLLIFTTVFSGCSLIHYPWRIHTTPIYRT